MCILGDEPSLEIEGVWLFRGLGIPQEAIDHPQFEYYKNRKMDIHNPDDVKLIREFWGGKEGGIANGQKITSISCHK